ncbi:MAG: plasmid mobilization protein, partial [Thermoplasmata archaeon]
MKLSQNIIMRVSPEEKEIIRKKAEAHHLSLSRYLILLGLRGKI